MKNTRVYVYRFYHLRLLRNCKMPSPLLQYCTEKCFNFFLENGLNKFDRFKMVLWASNSVIYCFDGCIICPKNWIADLLFKEMSVFEHCRLESERIKKVWTCNKFDANTPNNQTVLKTTQNNVWNYEFYLWTDFVSLSYS